MRSTILVRVIPSIKMLSVESSDSNPPSIDWVMSDDAFNELYNERSVGIQRIQSIYVSTAGFLS